MAAIIRTTVTMPKLPLKYQVTIGPALITTILILLVWFTLSQFELIRTQNDGIRRWAMLTDKLIIATNAAKHMSTISEQLANDTVSDPEALTFSYIEQTTIFIDYLQHDDIMEIIEPALRDDFDTVVTATRYRENIDHNNALLAVQAFIPKLEQLHDTWWGNKRIAYIDYYENLQSISARLVNVSIGVLILCIILTGALSLWSMFIIRKRIRILSATAQSVIRRNNTGVPVINNPADELDLLTNSISVIAQRFVNVVSVEKLLEGAEQERKRIAMDMHDAVLSDLTSISRQLESTPSNEKVSHQVSDVINNIRNIIDDLHPRSLEILGLEPALTAYAERASNSVKNSHDRPDFFIDADKNIDYSIKEFQQISIYRIACEVVTNIIRHAQCTRYELTLKQTKNNFKLKIEDNGIGFDAHSLGAHHGHGLLNIQERARSIGAIVDWTSSRFTTGTCFELKLTCSN